MTGLGAAIGGHFGKFIDGFGPLEYLIPDSIAGGWGTTVGAINGAFSGARGTYDWGSYTGYLAFGADSSWGLYGTTLGDISNIANSLAGDYNADLSRRSNVHVYEDSIGPFWDANGEGVTLGNLGGDRNVSGTRTYKVTGPSRALPQASTRYFRCSGW